jgi:hypothetical protein
VNVDANSESAIAAAIPRRNQSRSNHGFHVSPHAAVGVAIAACKVMAGFIDGVAAGFAGRSRLLC